jgi:subtilisin family serine protease
MRALIGVVLAMLVCSSFVLAAARPPSNPATPFTPGEVVVVVAPGSAWAALAADGRAASGTLAATLAQFGIARVDNLRRATPAASRGVEVLRLVSDQPGFDPVAAARALRAEPGVIGAAPNLHLRLHVVPNDPQFSQQWWLSNSAAGVHAQQGWARETGKPAVLIAIMDTGVDLGHEDLASKIWTNPGEIAGNGLDDDHDGYVDDVHGWDFGDNDNDPSPEPMIDPSAGIDVGWHGTFVAGLAAAATNNAVGIAGIAWGCQILPLKVSDAAGDIPLTAVASAFDYAVAQHVAVINMSFGATDTSAASVFQPLVNEAFNANIVCVASAGNDGTDALTYPAACESVLAVASTNASNLRSSFSNWGPYVDMCAPGEGMWSTIASNYIYDDTSQIFFEFLWGWDGVTPYMSNDGTSFSAPIVSGGAALIRSHAPGMSALQVMRLLVSSGDVKVYDDPIGPKLNLDRALATVLAASPASLGTSRLALAPAPNPTARAMTLSFSMPAAGETRLAIYDAAGRLVRVIADGARAAGAHAEAWDLTGADGAAVRPGLYFARLETAGERLTRRIAVIR